MMRCAFKMKLKPGFEAEYQKRHSEIWPELVKMLKDSGVYDYSIFWDKVTNILFAVQKIKVIRLHRTWVQPRLYRSGGITWPISWRPIRITHRYQFRCLNSFIWSKG